MTAAVAREGAPVVAQSDTAGALERGADPVAAIAREFPGADVCLCAVWAGTVPGDMIVWMGDPADLSVRPLAERGRGLYVLRFVRSRGGVDPGAYLGDRLVHVK